MRRWIVRALWGALLLVLVLAAGVGAMFGITFMGNADLRDGEQLSPFARIVKDGFVSIAVLDMGNGKVALIDAGNDPEAQALNSALARMKKKRADVQAVFLTHGHQDHLQGLYALPGARVYGLAHEAALVGGRRRNRGPLTRHFAPQRTGLEVSHPLRDGESVRIGERTLRVFAVPGHTRGSAALRRGPAFPGRQRRRQQRRRAHPRQMAVQRRSRSKPSFSTCPRSASRARKAARQAYGLRAYGKPSGHLRPASLQS